MNIFEKYPAKGTYQYGIMSCHWLSSLWSRVCPQHHDRSPHSFLSYKTSHSGDSRNQWCGWMGEDSLFLSIVFRQNSINGM